MTVLLWVRTSRHVNTLGPEIDHLRHEILPYCDLVAFDECEPFLGADHLLFGIRSRLSLHQLRAQLGTAMQESFVEDWSMTDVGGGVGPAGAAYQEMGSGERYYDDRFRDLDAEGYASANDERQDRAALALDLTPLNWDLDYDCRGASGLWVDLQRPRKDGVDPFLRRLESALPRPTQRLWHGRSSMLYAYSSRHDFLSPAPYGLTNEVLDILYGDEVAYFLAFGIGNKSMGGVAENLNPLSDWIWRSRPQRQRPQVGVPLAKAASTSGPKHKQVVVQVSRRRFPPR